MSLALSTRDIQHDPTDYSSKGLGLRAIWNPLFWTCMTTCGSAYAGLRFEVAGMAFHPYMVTLIPLMFRAIPRLPRFPARIGRPGALFLLLYIISLIQGSSFIIQLAKIGLMTLTFVVIALSVRSMDDFLAGAMGLGIGVVILCIRGFIKGVGNFGSINPIEGSQKNAFSLFYLPALTVCLYLLFSPLLRVNRKMILAMIVTITFAGIALSKNRSGWLATGVILLMLFGTHRRQIRIFIVLGVAACLAYAVAFVVLSEADFVYERDAGRTVESDNLRIELFRRAVTIGLQHPLIGVSPARLMMMLGNDIDKMSDVGTDCHNLTGYLIGGSGLITFAAFCLFIYAMIRSPSGVNQDSNLLITESVRLLKTIVIVWMVRAQFQEDALFSPTFACGIGICVGLCICAGVYAPKSSAAWDPGPEKEYRDEDELMLDGPSLGNRPNHLLGTE